MVYENLFSCGADPTYARKQNARWGRGRRTVGVPDRSGQNSMDKSVHTGTDITM